MVDKNNWLATDSYDDTFGITLDGDSVTVTRSDATGGWCVPLSFQCCKGMLLMFNFQYILQHTIKPYV